MKGKPILTSGMKGFIEICVDRITRQGRPATQGVLGRLKESEKALVQKCLATVNPETYEIGDWCEIIDPPRRCDVHPRYDGEAEPEELGLDYLHCHCHEIWKWRQG